MNNDESLRDAIRDTLAQLGIQQARAARDSGQHFTCICHLLAGRRSLGAPTGVRLLNCVNRELAARLGKRATHCKSLATASEYFYQLRGEFALARAVESADRLMAGQEK